MVCHELWKHDFKRRHAALVGFELVCPLCNFSLHLGRTAAVMAEDRPELMQEVTRHMAEVNGISEKEVMRLAMHGLVDWLAGPDGKWKVTIDDALRRAHPELKGLRL